MGRELRLGFAMGGGVSLGTFNGAALSEVMKLAVLHGSYQDDAGKWQRYDRVVVDVFSGASAGAMSLAIMLRSLAHPDPDLRHLADKQLRKRHQTVDFDDLQTNDPERYERAIAAQIVQHKQEVVWSDQGVNIGMLLREAPQGAPQLKRAPSLLNRAAIDNLAVEHLGWPSTEIQADGTVVLTRSPLLGDRVLFACTISNLAPQEADSRPELTQVPAYQRALRDGATSLVHRELRVFDLNFARVEAGDLRQEKRYPLRWCRYHLAKEAGGKVGDLRKLDAWSRIVATAVASGAFPFAFEPVVLNRRWYEHGGEAGAPDRLCTYMDGGVFNNEPIREAFRLAAHLDGLTPEANFDRCIVYVDPFVADNSPSQRVALHQEYTIAAPFLLGDAVGSKLRRKEPSERLLSFLGTLIGAISDEARGVEADKIYAVRKQFELRRLTRKHLHANLTEAPKAEAVKALKEEVLQALRKLNGSEMVPAHIPDLAHEICRVIAQDQRQNKAASIFAGLEPKADAAAKFLADPGAESFKESGKLWLRALAFLAMDLAMNLAGKDESAKLIAIAPCLKPEDPSSPILNLPGGRISGFAGFCSSIPEVYEQQVGRYCAAQFLQLAGLAVKIPVPPVPTFSDDDERAYREDLDRGLKVLVKRLGSLLPIPTWLLLYLVQGKLDSGPEVPRETFEFRLFLPADGTYELDGRNWNDNDIEPVEIEGRPCLVTYLTYAWGERAWTGFGLNPEGTALEIDNDGILRDRGYCLLGLPDVSSLKKARTYQYCCFEVDLAKLKVPSSRDILQNAWELKELLVSLEAKLLEWMTP